MDDRVDVIVGWWSDRFQIEDKREAFANALRSLVATVLEDPGSLGHRANYDPASNSFYLQVDYDPWDLLLDAVQAAGIERYGYGYGFSAEGILPFKTRMHVSPDSIMVCEGYAAPYVPIWTRAAGG